jgi:hypothetical protein
MFTTSRKAKMTAALALLPLAGFATLASGAQYVPLFNPLPIKNSWVSPPPGPYYIDNTYVYGTATVVSHCDAPTTAYIKSVKPDGSGYGPPLADNYITAGNDKTSVCQGGPALPAPLNPAFPPVGGTHCFKSGSTSPTMVPIEQTFDATGISAPISLNAGANTTTFKLWDYGGVYGNARLVLELPAACGTVNQWCSPGYWKNHPAAWAPLAPAITMSTPYTGPINYDAKKCGRTGAPPHPTLFEVVDNPQCYGGEAANAVADMLSTAHPDISFYGIRVEGSCPLN